MPAPATFKVTFVTATEQREIPVFDGLRRKAAAEFLEDVTGYLASHVERTWLAGIQVGAQREMGQEFGLILNSMNVRIERLT